MIAIYDLSQPKDARTGAPVRLKMPTVNLTRGRVNELSLKELVRVIDRLQEYVLAFVASFLDLPLGGPIVYLKNVSFTSGVNLTLSHNIAVTPATGFPAEGVTRVQSPTQIRFLVVHKQAYGDIHFVSVDTRTMTLVANATMTADILFWVTP